jgi:hypothetical protein
MDLYGSGNPQLLLTQMAQGVEAMMMLRRNTRLAYPNKKSKNP